MCEYTHLILDHPGDQRKQDWYSHLLGCDSCREAWRVTIGLEAESPRIGVSLRGITFHGVNGSTRRIKA